MPGRKSLFAGSTVRLHLTVPADTAAKVRGLGNPSRVVATTLDDFLRHKDRLSSLERELDQATEIAALKDQASMLAADRARLAKAVAAFTVQLKELGDLSRSVKQDIRHASADLRPKLFALYRRIRRAMGDVEGKLDHAKAAMGGQDGGLGPGVLT